MSSHRSSMEEENGPVRLSQMIGSPTFRSAAINAVAVIPLLSSRNGRDDPNTQSSKSFETFLRSLHRHNHTNRTNARMQQTLPTVAKKGNGDVVVVVPNSNLTRPSEWKYNETPLKNFHWAHGCQRLRFFDGRPYHSRSAHDRLINHELTRNWIDLCPSRRTAALIGILSVKDCPDQTTLETAIQEWKQWAERYSTPPYEVTALGRDVSRDIVVPRLFVFDSFHEDFVNNPNVDLSAATQKLHLSPKSIVAFPPSDQERSLDLHVNVVVNDLTVAIFQELESKIRESDSLMTTKSSATPGGQQSKSRAFFSRGVSSSSGATSVSETSEKDADLPVGSKKLSIEALGALVSSHSELASPKRSSSADTSSSSNSGNAGAISMSSSVKAQLLTPLDDFWEYTELSPKDAHMMMKREVARRQKFTADLCLLAGSPLDAYERYTKAADLSKTTSPDPLWYASALEGCAAVHIAMADVGGFNVDEYLESSFQLPEELMSCALVPADKTSSESSIKKSMPQVVVALCEDALNILSRHPKITCFHSELCLKLAWYIAEVEDVHVRCQWGLGGDDDDGEDEYCYGGDPTNEKRRWEMASATRLNFLELKNRDGDVIQANTFKRLQKCCDYMHRAAASAALEPVTRTDVALRCLAIAWKGIRPTVKPTILERSTERIQLKRKAAFFAVTAAEAMSDVHGAIPAERANAMWIQASKLLSETANDLVSGGNYAWATLRAVALHALAIQGTKESSEEAAKQLLMLMSEISPPNTPKSQNFLMESPNSPSREEGSSSGRSLSYSGVRSYIRDGAKQVTSRSKELFGNADAASLLVAQSKWVDDDPVDASFVPMGEFSSDFAMEVIGLPSVWTAIRFENCSVAQEHLLQEIYELRKNIPASTLQNANHSKESSVQKLPIEITSIGVVNPDSSLDLERVQVKQKRTSDESNPAMATFFNPYAKQEKKIKPKTVPRGEEQYVSITFTNRLSIPFIVDSCKLEFNVPKSGLIKAPSISFTVPGRAINFAVRFPFIVLEKLRNEEVDTMEIKGIFITALSRSIFLPLGSPEDENNSSMQSEKEESTIPKSTSFYPRRDYTKKGRLEDQKSTVIFSPRLEITPPQPKLRVSFASSSTPMDDESIIPVLLADGETFVLPKICVSNDTGLDGLGVVEELQISAIGLPGLSEVVMYDMSGSKEADGVPPKPPAISISADCIGMDAETLNSKNSMASFITAQLSASPAMGAVTKGCDMTLRFKYRGKAVSSSLEVWRKYEVEVKILRVKGPRIPSLSFRCDLFWESGYTEMCKALASTRKNQNVVSYDFEDVIENKQEFVENRLGRDPGIHVCGNEVVIMVSVANESSCPIVLTRVDGSPFGFANSKIKSMKVSKGVSAKFPILLPRIERSANVCKELINMLKFNWRSDIPGSQPDDAQETGGPMFPANCRVRQGLLEVPFECLNTIIDEHPIFLSRICKSPCSIEVSVAKTSNITTIRKADIGKPIDVAVTVEMAKWLSSDLKKRTKGVLSFCCARQSGGEEHPALSETVANQSKGFVWIGQTRKNLRLGEAASEKMQQTAKIMFLSEGDYFVSACLSLSGENDSETGIEEVWWAEKAAKMRISKN